MTLEDLANVGELIGGIAVVASLIYLAIQIRQNTASVRSATHATNTDIWTSMLIQVASPQFNEAYLHGSSGNPDLKPHQFLQFYLINRALFVAFENQFYQYSHGTLDPEIYMGYERSFKNQLLSFPGFQIYWQLTRHEFTPEFAARVDKFIGEVSDSNPGRLFTQWQELARSVQNPGDSDPAAGE